MEGFGPERVYMNPGTGGPGMYSCSDESPPETNFNGSKSPDCVRVGDSPLPYIVAGMVAIVLLVVVCFCFLIASFLKQLNHHHGEVAAGNAGGREASIARLRRLLSMKASGGSSDADPMHETDKIVVIMAGDVEPTYLAQPAPRPSHVLKRNSGDDCSEIV